MHHCTFWAKGENNVPCRCPAKSWKCCKTICAWNGPDQLPIPVHFAKRTPARSADDASWTPLAIPPSSIAEHGSFRQSAPISTYFRSGHGARGHLLTRPPAPHGSCADSHHHALCPTGAPGHLARICARGRQAHARACDLSKDAMKQSRQSLEQIFQNQAEILSLTLQPFTVVKYQYVARYFVGYLRAEFPEVCRLSQLRRDPHMLGFFRWLCELRPPIGTHTRQQRLLCLRRLLNDLAAQGHPLPPGLIIREDFPALPEYLPRPLSPEDDHRLQEELRRKDDLGRY